jgi:hypothetical protein
MPTLTLGQPGLWTDDYLAANQNGYGLATASPPAPTHRTPLHYDLAAMPAYAR